MGLTRTDNLFIMTELSSTFFSTSKTDIVLAPSSSYTGINLLPSTPGYRQFQSCFKIYHGNDLALH